MTYSRWERGVSTPPLVKMLNIAKVFNLDIFEFLTTITFKPSQNQISAFDNLLKYYDNINNHYRILNMKLNNETFHYFNSESEMVPEEILTQTKKRWDVILKLMQKPDDVYKVDCLESLRKSGTIHISSCIDPETKEILAQGIYVLQDIQEEKCLLENFENKDMSIDKLVHVDNTSEKFLFIPIVAFHSSPWLRFNIYNLVKTFTKTNGVKKIYLLASQIKTFSKLRYLGFDIERSIKSEIKNKIGNSYVKSEVSLHLISCDFDTFICNHGLINLIKSYKDY
ncbi:helix-turn-helix domain-containing protein [Vibrio parahaemolyticus]|nr:helix-turn-helix domain-containing protein [Vibrio parahaemolyticus]